MAGKRQLSAWDITVLHEKAEMEEAEAATTTRETYVATCKTCRLQFAYTGQEPDECARCCPDTASTWQPSQGVDRIVPIPYKPPSPELMKLLEQAQQLASDAVMYGSAFWTVGLDGSKRRVDPAAVRAVVDGIAVEAEPRYLHLPKVRHEGENLPPHIQAMISDYAKAWENDIMTVGNADQVGGLKNILSRTHEADKPGATTMDETDFDTGPLRGRFKTHPDMRGAYGSADASNPLTTVTNMGTGAIRMTKTDVFADGAALAAATDGRFVPLLDGRTLDTHGMDDGIALTSMHPFSVQGAWERCLNGKGSSADHETVMTEYRRANAAGEFDRLGEDDPARALEALGNAPRRDSLNTSWNVPISAMNRCDRVSGAADGVEATLGAGQGNATMGLTDWYGLCGHVWKYTQGSQCPECCGKTSAFAPRVPVTDEMKRIGFQVGLEHQPRAPLQVETLEAIYRAMHAAAPVPLSPDAKGLVGALEETAERWYDVADLIESPEGYRNGGFPRESAWRCLNAIELYKNLPVPLVSEAEDRVAALEREITELRRTRRNLFDLKEQYRCEVADLKRRVATEQPTDIDYNGPVKDGRAIPDPSHEQFHRSIGDVLAGKIIPAARRQMEDALGRAPKEPITAPDAILRGNKAPVGIVERKT